MLAPLKPAKDAHGSLGDAAADIHHCLGRLTCCALHILEFSMHQLAVLVTLCWNVEACMHDTVHSLQRGTVLVRLWTFSKAWCSMVEMQVECLTTLYSHA